MKDIIRIIFSKDNIEPQINGRALTFVSLFFSFIAVLLTGLNIYMHRTFMAVATTILAVGLATASYFSHKNKVTTCQHIIVYLVAGIFSAFAITGGNYGFAILWIILIPLIGTIFVGIKLGFLIGLYFQIFLIVLFYTPLSEYVKDYYTPTFITRFPVLYLATFVSITGLMCKRQQLYNEIHHQAYYDAMTNLLNRRRYNEDCNRIRKNHNADKVSVLSFDLNRLKYYNDSVGHDAGDEMIKGTADLLLRAFGADDCFRIGGDEFAVLSERKADDLLLSIEDFHKSVEQWHGKLAPELSVSVGYALAEDHPNKTFTELCLLADQNMYADKNKFYVSTQSPRR